MSNIERQVGEKIKKLRLAEGLGQAQLAEIVGCVQPQISHYERAIDPPPLLTLYRISRYFGVPMCEFFGQGHA